MAGCSSLLERRLTISASKMAPSKTYPTLSFESQLKERRTQAGCYGNGIHRPVAAGLRAGAP